MLLSWMKRTASSGGRTDAAKRPKVDSLPVQLRDRFGLQWSGEGPNIRPGLPYMFVLHRADAKATKVAVFDMDWTLIKPKSGGKWPKGPSDWCWLFPQVPAKLQQLAKDDFLLVLVSNQNGIEKGNTKADDIKQKIGEMVLQLDIPLEAIFFPGETHFRKPATAGWDCYQRRLLGPSVDIDLDASMYVGDAAGRPKDYRPGRKKDFSCSDRMFAANIGIANFQTPEEFFLGEKKAPFSWGSVDPRQLLEKAEAAKAERYHAEAPEVVLLVGSPASGKSSFAERHLVPHGYTRVNRDELKTPAKCLEAARRALDAGRSVVVDNTNPGAADRRPYRELAALRGLPCRVFLMETPREVAAHLNYFRQAQTESAVRRIPRVAYNVFKSRFQAPTAQEGFAEVKRIPFMPELRSERDRKLFLKWTADV